MMQPFARLQEFENLVLELARVPFMRIKLNDCLLLDGFEYSPLRLGQRALNGFDFLSKIKLRVLTITNKSCVELALKTGFVLRDDLICHLDRSKHNSAVRQHFLDSLILPGLHALVSVPESLQS